MGSPRSGGSASSGKHVDCSSDGRGSGGELLGTLNAGEVDGDLGWHGGGHWCPSWLVRVFGGLDGLAGLDGTPGAVADAISDVHPNSSSTAAESFSAGLLTSGWSVGTVGECFLTSSTGSSWGWLCELGLQEGLDGLEVGGTLNHLSLQGSSVCVVGLDLACENGGILGFLGGLKIFLSAFGGQDGGNE